MPGPNGFLRNVLSNCLKSTIKRELDNRTLYEMLHRRPPSRWLFSESTDFASAHKPQRRCPGQGGRRPGANLSGCSGGNERGRRSHTAFWSVPVHVVDVGRFPPEFCVRGTSSSSVRWSLVTTGPSVTRLPDSSFKLPNRRQRGPLTTVARPEPPSSQTTRKGAVSRSPGQIEIRGRLAGGEGSAV